MTGCGSVWLNFFGLHCLVFAAISVLEIWQAINTSFSLACRSTAVFFENFRVGWRD